MSARAARAGLATADDVREELAALADPDRAEAVARYFARDAAPGDRFLGVPLPVQRRVARRARGLPLDEVAALLADDVHEHRQTALVVLAERARRAKGDAERDELARFYLDHRAGVNHWDLVDASARDLLGHTPMATLEGLAASASPWDRRIAIVATRAHIARGEYDATFALCERLLADDHHLVVKGAGWMLREIGKRDPAALVAWLDDHAPRLPRTMLRPALERLDPADRERFMAAR